MTTQEIINWIHEFIPYATDKECLEAYAIYCTYSKQYAGL